MTHWNITLSEGEEEAFASFLHGQLRAFNNQVSPFHRESRKPGGVVPLHVILNDETGAFLGGITGKTYWTWLEIDCFYLPEALRKHGLGSQLLEKAQAAAAARGCKSCFLTTYEFQARIFYEKHGFKVVGTLEDYPPGSAYYWMRKDFTPAP
ncbi:MAG TPA: GNAT family N-acetyltransferase [Anaerolineaceae bacterium]|nr:GNAT family N-acetyltransferase [Anaerolineaceae bacterium]